MTTTVVVGNPRPGSRTLAAAVQVAHDLSGSAPDHVLDLGPGGGAALESGQEYFAWFHGWVFRHASIRY